MSCGVFTTIIKTLNIYMNRRYPQQTNKKPDDSVDKVIIYYQLHTESSFRAFVSNFYAVLLRFATFFGIPMFERAKCSSLIFNLFAATSSTFWFHLATCVRYTTFIFFELFPFNLEATEHNGIFNVDFVFW